MNEQKEPILVRFESGRPTELHTDASLAGLGAMLFQTGEDGVRRLVYATSRKLSNSELNYHSTKLEQLAVVWATKRLRHYLFGEKFKVVSDCNAVAALRSKDGETPQLARWLDQLAEFDFTVEHRPGSSMQHVDAPSRDPVEEGEDVEEETSPTELTKTVLAINIEEESALKLIQTVDAETRELIDILSKPAQERTQREKNRTSGFEVRKGMLFRKEKDRRLFVVPVRSRKYITLLAHDRTGHFGVDKTIETIRRSYWFPKMREYVTFHIRACMDCLFNKEQSGKEEGLLNPIRPARRPMAKLFIDHVGPLVSSRGKQHMYHCLGGWTNQVCNPEGGEINLRKKSYRAPGRSLQRLRRTGDARVRSRHSVHGEGDGEVPGTTWGETRESLGPTTTSKRTM